MSNEPTAEWVQNVVWESKEFFRLVCDNMSSSNSPSVTQSLFRDQLFHDYLHYFRIFRAHFLMKIDRNIISTFIYSSHFARELVSVMSTDFTNVIKVDENVDVNEISLLNT